MPMAMLPWLPLVLALFCAGVFVFLNPAPERDAAQALIALAFGLAGLAVWLSRLTLRRGPSDTAMPAVLLHPSLPASDAAPRQPERRRNPRRSVDLAVEIEWLRGRHQPSRLKDISRGGARALSAEAIPAGKRGLLHLPEFSLPVPFTVVEWRPETGLHLRFDLEGMGLDALKRQLDGLLSRE
jgi:hypothetical protein